MNSVISQNKPINRYEQELIIYELRSRIKTINEELFQSNEDYNNLLKEYKKYIKLLDADFIVNYSKFCETMAQKKVFLMLGEFDNSVLYSKVLTGTDITVQRFNNNHRT